MNGSSSDIIRHRRSSWNIYSICGVMNAKNVILTPRVLCKVPMWNGNSTFLEVRLHDMHEHTRRAPKDSDFYAAQRLHSMSNLNGGKVTLHLDLRTMEIHRDLNFWGDCWPLAHVAWSHWVVDGHWAWDVTEVCHVLLDSLMARTTSFVRLWLGRLLAQTVVSNLD